MPLYVKLFEEDKDNAEQGAKVEKGAFLLIKDKKKVQIVGEKSDVPRAHYTPLSDGEYQKVVKKCSDFIDDMVKKVKKLDFMENVNPDEEVCRACDYCAVCRKAYSVAGASL
jgi:hypothetical protein